MRKIFAGLVLFGLTISYAHAVSVFACSKCDPDLMKVGSAPDGQSYDTCEQMCQALKNSMPAYGATGDPNEYGVYVYQTWTYEETCGAWVGGGMGRLGSCHAVPEDNYKCGKGYYGTATSETSGCTKCPANATCTNGIIFNCNSGWYENDAGNGCSPCPDPETGPNDEKNWTVASSSSVGSPGVMMGQTGATDIGQCYLTNTSVVTDNTGTYEIEGATGGGGFSGPGKYCDYYGKY